MSYKVHLIVDLVVSFHCLFGLLNPESELSFAEFVDSTVKRNRYVVKNTNQLYRQMYIWQDKRVPMYILSYI